MRFFRKIILFFLIFTPYLANCEIYKVSDLEQLENELMSSLKTKNPKETLVIMPLDMILQPDHAAFYFKKDAYKNIVKNSIAKIKFSKKPYLDELILINYPHKLSNIKIKSIISEIQSLNPSLIITTKNISGSINDVRYLELWTWKYLYDLGINLSLSPIGDKQIKLSHNRKKFIGTYPTFYKGLLSSNSYEKYNSMQNVIAELLITKIKKLPKVIYIIDSDENYISSMISQFKNLNQEILIEGFVYKPDAGREYDQLESEGFEIFWKNFVAKLNQVKRLEIDINTEDPYEQ